jgi:ribosomal protein S17
MYLVSFNKRSAAIHATVPRIHQRMDDVGARGTNESNRVRDSKCNGASTRPISKSRSFDVLNVENLNVG